MNQYHADGYPELYRLSNLDEHGKPTGHHPTRAPWWHTDGSLAAGHRQATIILRRVMPPSGGETHFCDMYGAKNAWTRLGRRASPSCGRAHLDFSDQNRRHGEDP